MNPKQATSNELQELKDFFQYCDDGRVTQDILFGFPNGLFKRDPVDVCQNLQAGYNLLCQICPRSPNPTAELKGKIRIGYRHPDDEPNGKMPVAGYWGPDRRINVPWERLTETDTQPIDCVPIKFQPEFCCSHELVHPFEAIFLKTNSNKKWKEAFCDCLRVFVLDHLELKSLATQFAAFVRNQATIKSRCQYHDGAGRILNWLTDKVGCWKKADAGEIESALATLIGCDMEQELGNDILFGEQHVCKCKSVQWTV